MLKVTVEPQRIRLLRLILDEGLAAFLGGTLVCHAMFSESRGPVNLQVLWKAKSLVPRKQGKGGIFVSSV